MAIPSRRLITSSSMSPKTAAEEAKQREGAAKAAQAKSAAPAAKASATAVAEPEVEEEVGEAKYDPFLNDV